MTTKDYSALGFKSGLEIHQQLDTGKLFSRTPSLLRTDKPDYTLSRRLHAVAGETGEVDVAAKHQAAQDQEFLYQGYTDSISLVELDEEPPQLLDSDALLIALHIALHLHCTIIPLAQVMRKTVVDGSNTGGFQRTVMIARDGYVETSFGRVGISGLFLEEDSARPVERTKKKVVYNLDRLGIPLVEISTEPDIRTPEQAKEVALHIGDILRSCQVRRGIGTIRQDVNMSLKGGERVEIKGFQDIKNIERAIAIETERQEKLISQKKSVAEVRNVLADGTSKFLRPMPGAARMYPETDLPLLRISRDLVNEAKKTLPPLRSVLEKELRSQGLSEEHITLLFKEQKFAEYKDLHAILPEPPTIAKILLLYPRDLAKKEGLTVRQVYKKISLDSFVAVTEAVSKKKVSVSDVPVVLEKILSGKSVKVALTIEKVDTTEMEQKVQEIIAEKPGLRPNAYMGLVMAAFKGKVDGKTAMQLISKYAK